MKPPIPRASADVIDVPGLGRLTADQATTLGVDLIIWTRLTPGAVPAKRKSDPWLRMWRQVGVQYWSDRMLGLVRP